MHEFSQRLQVLCKDCMMCMVPSSIIISKALTEKDLLAPKLSRPKFDVINIPVVYVGNWLKRWKGYNMLLAWHMDSDWNIWSEGQTNWVRNGLKLVWNGHNILHALHMEGDWVRWSGALTNGHQWFRKNLNTWVRSLVNSAESKKDWPKT